MIALESELPNGSKLRLRWPRADEYDQLTIMRNKARRWFGDAVEVDLISSREWLARRTMEDCLLSMECDGHLIGAAGWLDLTDTITEWGRVVVDYDLVREGGVASNLTGFALPAMRRCMTYIASRGRVTYARTRNENLSARILTKRAGLTRLPGPPPGTPYRADASFDDWLEIRSAAQMAA